jgi:PAT family beta-lactamase induction signal transducer AmpG
LLKLFQKYWLLYVDPKVLGIFFLAISTGLPVSLGVDTFKVWMWEGGNSLELVALLNITSFPYIAKVFFGPLVDQLHVPVLHRLLGRRRAWSLVSQISMLIGFLLVGQVFGTSDLSITISLLILISFASAINHTALNAYRVEIVKPTSSYAAASAGSIGYRMGKLFGGGGALLVAAALGWYAAYAIIPMILVITIISTLLVPEPEVNHTDAEESLQYNVRQWFRMRFLRPLYQFMHNYKSEWKWMTLFILTVGVGDFLVEGIATIFYLDIGFDKAEVANIAKAFSIICTITGGVIGSHLVSIIGIHRMIYVTTFLHCISYVSLIGLSHMGDNLVLLYFSVLVEFLTEGMKTTAMVAYIGLLCGKTYYTASQYALFSSIKLLLRPFVGALSGVLAIYLGWSVFFIVGMVLSLIPLFFYSRIQQHPVHHA